MNTPDDWISTKDAARILDVDQHHVAWLLRGGYLQGKKLQREWLVSRSSVEAYKTNPTRKPKQKRI